jgi:hypothetical protein
MHPVKGSTATLRMIYTTNTVGNFDSKVGKITQNGWQESQGIYNYLLSYREESQIYLWGHR